MAEQPQSSESWDAGADAWIRFVEAGDPHREGLADPYMLEAVGDVAGAAVLDLGCGEGRFARMLATRGARVTGIDRVPRLIEHARAHAVGDEEYRVCDMEDLAPFADAGFDVAVSYLTLMDVVDFQAAIAEAARVLKPGGRFVVCQLQPMVTAGNTWVTQGDTRLHFKLDDYFAETARDMPPMGGHVFVNYHRTLSAYFNACLDAGLRLRGVVEPRPTPEALARYPSLVHNTRVPYFLITQWRK